MDDSNEDNANSTESTEQQNKKHVRKLGIIDVRSSESIYEDEKDDFSKDVDHHDAQNRFHGMVVRKNVDSAENRLEIQEI